MDPEQTLELVSIFIHKGSRASGWRARQYFNDAGEHLEAYWKWRKQGGVEPPKGDARAKRLGEKLSDAWEKHEVAEQRERDIHEENPKPKKRRRNRRRNREVSPWLLPVALISGLVLAGGILLGKSWREKKRKEAIG